MLTEKQLRAQRSQDTQKLSAEEKADMIRRVEQAHGVPAGIGAFNFVEVLKDRKGKGGKWTYGEILYATRRFAAWAAKENNISVEILKLDIGKTLVVCTVRLTMQDTFDGSPQRTWEAVGAVSLIDNKTGEQIKPSRMATKIMHAKTKAQRRGVLDMLGFGLLDESEVSDMDTAADNQAVEIDANAMLEDIRLGCEGEIKIRSGAGKLNDLDDVTDALDAVIAEYTDDIDGLSAPAAKKVRAGIKQIRTDLLARARKHFAEA